MLVLRSEEQLTALCAGTQLGLGGDLGLAVGLMGRHADAAVMVSEMPEQVVDAHPNLQREGPQGSR